MLNCSKLFGLLSALVLTALTVPTEFPVKLEVKVALNSRSANVHVSEAYPSLYPFTVTYGTCHSSSSKRDAYHTISKVHRQGTDRLIWVLPDDIHTSGCLSAWSSRNELVGMSEPLEVNKYSRQWMKKRHLDRGTRLSKRASIPMTSASGIVANGPWFDGVELLKEKEISAVNVAEAKAKSMYKFDTRNIAGICLSCIYRDCDCWRWHGWLDDLGERIHVVCIGIAGTDIIKSSVLI